MLQLPSKHANYPTSLSLLLTDSAIFVVKQVVKHVCDLRGGEDDSSDDLDDDFEDLDEDYDTEEGLVNEQDFGEANFVERLKQEWKKTPIITRTFFQVQLIDFSHRSGMALVLVPKHLVVRGQSTN